MTDPTNIELPLFSAAELAHVAGLDRGRVDLWVHRGFIKPTRVDRLTVRTRSSFSISAVFEATLIRILGDNLSMPVSDADSMAKEIAKAVIDDGKWMWYVARRVERGLSIVLFATTSRSSNCWQCTLHLGADGITSDFDAKVPFIVLPIGAMFASVYNDCKSILSGQPSPQKPKKAPRARS